jgi:hypothetical protein
VGSSRVGWCRLAVLAVVAVLLAGCFRYDVGTVVAADGSGHLTIAVVLGPEMLEAAGDDPFAAFDASMPASAQLSDITEGASMGRQAVLPFASLPELNRLVVGPLVGPVPQGSATAVFEHFEVVRDGPVFAFDAVHPEFIIDEGAGFDGADGAELDGTVVVVLQLPGTPFEHDADEVDGDVLTWRFPIQESATLMARSQVEVVGGYLDVAGNTHADAILWVTEQGIATGYADGTYRPSGTVTRGQMATVLTRAFDLPAGDGSFADVVAGSAHADGIAAVAVAGITDGFVDGTFRPDDPVTRGQMASFLQRALDLDAGGQTFTDVADNVHAEGITAVVEAGIATGFEDGTFRPDLPVTRGQMATLLVNAVDVT